MQAPAVEPETESAVLRSEFKAQPDLSVITVVTQPEEVRAVEKLLASIEESDFSGQLQVIVVCNGLPAEEMQLVREANGWPTFLFADRNLGYAGANNWGMLKSSGRLVLLMNPDIRVRRDSLSKLVGFVDEHPGIGGACGRLLGDDGKVQVGFNVKGLPTFFTAILETLLLDRALSWTRPVKRYLMTDMDFERAQRVEQPAGACLLVRRELIEQVGVMDERFFPVWFDDVDWCMRIRSYGWELWFVPDAVFDHSGAVSTKNWSKYDAVQVKYRNFTYFCKKHFGVTLAALIIGSIAAGMVLRSFLVLMGALFGKDLSGTVTHFRKGDTINAIKGYIRVFWLCITARL